MCWRHLIVYLSDVDLHISSPISTAPSLLFPKLNFFELVLILPSFEFLPPLCLHSSEQQVLWGLPLKCFWIWLLCFYLSPRGYLPSFSPWNLISSLSIYSSSTILLSELAFQNKQKFGHSITLAKKHCSLYILCRMVFKILRLAFKPSKPSLVTLPMNWSLWSCHLPHSLHTCCPLWFCSCWLIYRQ